MNTSDERKLREKERRRRYYLSHKEEENEYRRNYYRANRQSSLARVKKWRDENRDKVNAKRREWKKAHRAEERERANKYNKTHKDIVNAQRRRHYARHKDEINAKRRLKRRLKKEQPVVVIEAVSVIKPEKPAMPSQRNKAGWGYDRTGKRLLMTWQEEVADRAGKKLRPVCHLGQNERGNLKKPYLWYVAHGIPADERGEVTENNKAEVVMLRDMLNREREAREKK